MIAPTNEFDVAILGGGLAGLTLARQLLMARPETRIAVIEKRAFPVSETTHKVGESSVEIGAHYFGHQLQLKKHLTDQQLPKFGLRFFFKDAHQSLSEGTEVGGSEFFAAPSYQMDRGRLENYLAKTDAEMGATVFDGAWIREIVLDSSAGGTRDTNHKITIERNKERSTIQARWVVDASGRAAMIKRKLKLEEDLNHDINAVWFRIDSTIKVDGWCDDAEWQTLTGKVQRRWLSTNHLMGEGYWVWIIPLATGSTSVGIVADPNVHSLRDLNSFEKSIAWLEKFEPECAASLAPHLDKMQDFLAIKKMSRGSRQVFSADRWGLVGEAAAFLDPFYSPGSDFIAIGNKMVGKLIEDDLAGESITHLAPALQSIFLTLFQNNLLTYRDQYPLFGNPRIMALKFVWDYAVYWGFPALLHFNDKLTDVGFIQSLSKGIEEVRTMNVTMQEFFREWHVAEPHVNASAGFVNQNDIEVMTRLNEELTMPAGDEELRRRFTDNVALMRDLMFEMADRVKRRHEELPVTVPDGMTTSSHLESVFNVLNM